MTKRERVLAALKRLPVDRPPVAFWRHVPDLDHTAQGWAGADDVQVWLGTMDGGGRMLAKASFAQNRPDVGAATANPYWSASGFGAGVTMVG